MKIRGLIAASVCLIAFVSSAIAADAPPTIDVWPDKAPGSAGVT